MNIFTSFPNSLRVLCGSVLAGCAASAAADLGLFEGQTDIGLPAKTGSVIVQASDSYRVSGGGANMWFTNDAFHFVWKRVSGDFSLSADIEWLGSGGNAHRKACLVIRQDLEPAAAYVDVAVHGDGLTSLQYRRSPGAMTREIQANVTAPRRVQLARQGEVVYLSLPQAGGPCGPFIRVKFTDPLYVGLGVCAHDDQVLEQARFARVLLQTAPVGTGTNLVLHSTLETISVSSKDRRVVHHTLEHIEAPNWSPDGQQLVFNGGGRLYRIPARGGQPEPIDTGFAVHCNNDHGFSPGGKELAISDQTRGGKSLVYTLPATGGEPRLVTTSGPSYWHGWSPDGAMLAYCAERGGEFDIYTVPVAGGQEVRLTTAKGLDDGPDYSPDGKHIYFNSERTGAMQIWRMKPDGTAQEQVTADDFNNWFPHPSPDGKWVVFLSYEKDVTGHPANKPVRLRLLNLATGAVEELAALFGGQGTINVPSWSPDSKQLAFVSYELLAP